MEKVVDSLKKGLYADAGGAEGDVLSELQKMLEILREGALKPTEIEKAQRMSELLGKMIPDQKDLANKSEMSRDAAKIAQQMADLKQRLSDVISEQKDLMKKAQDLKDGDPALTKLAEMRQQVQELLDKQEEMRQKLDATQEMDKLALEGEAQKNLADKASQVAKSLDSASKDSQMQSAMSKSGADSKSLSDASQSTSKASQSMSQAGDQASKTDADKASQKQDQAAYDLKKALEALDNAIAKATGNTPAGQLAQKQKDLQNRTDQIEKDAKALADKTSTPTNTGNLSKASDSMGKAGDKLSGQKPRDAVKHQQDAIAALEDKKLNKLAERGAAHRRQAQGDRRPAGQEAGRPQRPHEEAGRGHGPEEQQAARRHARQGLDEQGLAVRQEPQGKLSKGQSGQANSDQKDAAKSMEDAKKQLDEAIAKTQQDEQEKTMTKIAEILQEHAHPAAGPLDQDGQYRLQARR